MLLSKRRFCSVFLFDFPEDRHPLFSPRKELKRKDTTTSAQYNACLRLVVPYIFSSMQEPGTSGRSFSVRLGKHPAGAGATVAEAVPFCAQRS